MSNWENVPWYVIVIFSQIWINSEKKFNDLEKYFLKAQTKLKRVCNTDIIIHKNANCTSIITTSYAGEV